MRLFFLSRNYKGLGSAGNKAKTDIERIMEGMGIRHASLPRTTCHGTLPHFFLTLLGMLVASFRLGKGDILVLQYPLKTNIFLAQTRIFTPQRRILALGMHQVDIPIPEV